ncbi:MAG TPA: hypothetical protein VK509_07070 [Polyangiales bacterium]|nr:hypothetical protein [Polyangiales bacterium]
MRNVLSPFCCVLALAAFGCGSNASGGDPYEQAASEVESAVSALADDDSDDSAIDGAADGSDAATPDDDGDSDEATEEANGGHEGKDRGGSGRRGGHHGRGHRHGRGHDLLLWYADLDALQMCRDLRESCQASADASTCKDEVKACVKPVIDAAFAAMCEERVALCSADDAPERSCKRVDKHCAADMPDGG